MMGLVKWSVAVLALIVVPVTATAADGFRDFITSNDDYYVWVFWEGQLTFPEKRKYTINARATDIMGNVQMEEDPERFDGTGDWPLIKVKVR
jgi:hypothetical protein